DRAGKRMAVEHGQRVGAVLVEADHGGDAIGEQSEAAGDQRGVRAMDAHGADQRPRARRQLDALAQHLVDDGDFQPFEQRDELAQRRLEGNLAAHGPLGDRRDVRFEPDVIGELVDALLADHRGVHVGEEQLLLPVRDGLHDDIDRRIEDGAHALGEGALVELGFRGKGNVGGRAVGKPARRGGAGELRTRAVDQRRFERAGAAGDQSSDVSHRMSETKRVVLIAGPTASGKSALALQLAERLGGAVVNADSMQVYRDLRIITARPPPEEEARAPHRLYGHVDAAENYSTGCWSRDVAEVLDEVAREGRVPILVGGTGLYFKALTGGLAAVPPIPADIRADVRGRLAAEGVAPLYNELLERDPKTAHRLMPNDRSRISRALEVVLATGRSLSDWHAQGFPPLIVGASAAKVFITCERKELVRRIEARFAA